MIERYSYFYVACETLRKRDERRALNIRRCKQLLTLAVPTINVAAFCYLTLANALWIFALQLLVAVLAYIAMRNYNRKNATQTFVIPPRDVNTVATKPIAIEPAGAEKTRCRARRRQRRPVATYTGLNIFVVVKPTHRWRGRPLHRHAPINPIATIQPTDGWEE